MATQIFFIFTLKLREMIQFDEHIFQMGWFNHQLDIFPHFSTLFVPLNLLLTREHQGFHRCQVITRVNARCRIVLIKVYVHVPEMHCMHQTHAYHIHINMCTQIMLWTVQNDNNLQIRLQIRVLLISSPQKKVAKIIQVGVILSSKFKIDFFLTRFHLIHISFLRGVFSKLQQSNNLAE